MFLFAICVPVMSEVRVCCESSSSIRAARPAYPDRHQSAFLVFRQRTGQLRSTSSSVTVLHLSLSDRELFCVRGPHMARPGTIPTNRRMSYFQPSRAFRSSELTR